MGKSIKSVKHWVQRKDLEEQDYKNISNYFLNGSVSFITIRMMNRGDRTMREDVAIAIVAYCDIQSDVHTTKEEIMYEAEKKWQAYVTDQAKQALTPERKSHIAQQLAV